MHVAHGMASVTSANSWQRVANSVQHRLPQVFASLSFPPWDGRSV